LRWLFWGPVPSLPCVVRNGSVKDLKRTHGAHQHHSLLLLIKRALPTGMTKASVLLARLPTFFRCVSQDVARVKVGPFQVGILQQSELVAPIFLMLLPRSIVDEPDGAECCGTSSGNAR
jgi:hypothetical protein